MPFRAGAGRLRYVRGSCGNTYHPGNSIDPVIVRRCADPIGRSKPLRVLQSDYDSYGNMWVDPPGNGYKYGIGPGREIRRPAISIRRHCPEVTPGRRAASDRKTPTRSPFQQKDCRVYGKAWVVITKVFCGYLSGNPEYFRIAPWLPGIGTLSQRRAFRFMIEEVRSCARGNLCCPPTRFFAPLDRVASEQFQLPRSLWKKSQRRRVLYPRLADQA